MCDTLARVGANGTLFAKNSDRPRNEVQVVRWYPSRPAGPELRTQYLTIDDQPTAGVMLSQPTWLWGAEHGVNEHGVAIGNEKVWACRPPDAGPALIGMDLVRLGLERAATADEALEVMTALLRRHGQGGSCHADTRDPYDSSFLIADARGGWVVETCGRDWVAAPLGTGTSISNRYSIGTDWTRGAPDIGPGLSTSQWHDPHVDTRRADRRLAVTRTCVSALDVIDPRPVIATLRDHGTGPWGAPGSGDIPQPPPSDSSTDGAGVTVCMHGTATATSPSTTTASLVAWLPSAEGAAIVTWVCIGSPCVGEYVEVTLPHVPAALGSVAAWHAVAERRDRVEADPAALGPIRASLDAAEAATFA